MALDDHPNVFRYEGKLWVSLEPREVAHAQLVAQRAWDAAQAKQQRWWPAIAIGAAVGTAAVLGLGIFLGMPPAIYLFVLPVGFGVGAVLGASVNKRLLGSNDLGPDAPATARPQIPRLVRVPPGVARKAAPDSTASDLIAWSTRGFLGEAGL